MGQKTPNGKELQVVKITNSALYSVTFKSGGQLPEKLLGKWTSTQLAEKAITDYIESKEEEKKVVKSGKSNNN